MGRFTGKIALVTGSTQGLGEALVTQLAQEGLDGAIITGREPERGAGVCARLNALGCETELVLADLEQADQVESLIDAADGRFGRVDVLANCAAYTARGDVWDTTAALWDKMMAINVRAPFLLIQGIARLARRNQLPAAVVNIGSVVGYGGPPYITAYCVSKGAVMTLTRSMAYQLMRDHVRVVTVNPGWMDTPGEDATQREFHDAGDDWLERAEATRPFGRLIKTDEIARTLAFVLSDDAGMMTGATIDFDQTVLGAGDSPMPTEIPDGPSW